MNVLYEDAQVLAIDKPTGVPTIPDRFGSTSVKDLLEAARGERLFTVHRLDREVGGVLLFAREAAAHRTLSMAFERHEIRKRYEALTEGEPPAEGARFHWEDKLLRGKKRSYPSPHGKPAVTDSTFLGTEGTDTAAALRWSLEPLTGRNHQLRVHLSKAGFPILGDALYGATRPWPEGIALRAVELQIPALDGLGPLTITAPWPT